VGSDDWYEDDGLVRGESGGNDEWTMDDDRDRGGGGLYILVERFSTR
jgi:hypothetical protein